MNVGELLRERDRLLAVIEEAKVARARVKQLNILIAMYGDDEKVSLNGTTPTPRITSRDAICAKCGESFKGLRGVTMHNHKVHGGKPKMES